MIVVDVQIWPGGDSSRRQGLGVAAIANVSDLAAVSTYVCIAVDDRGNRREVVVRDHSRADGFWPLLARAFSSGASCTLTEEELRVAAAMVRRIASAGAWPAMPSPGG